MGTQTRATMPEKRKRDGPGDGNDDEEGEFEVEKISKKRKNNVSAHPCASRRSLIEVCIAGSARILC